MPPRDSACRQRLPPLRLALTRRAARSERDAQCRAPLYFAADFILI
jgi:hypothetical protein